MKTHVTSEPRRTFLKETATLGAAAFVAGHAPPWVAAFAQASQTPDWRKQVGLQLYTVRDVTGRDLEGTLAKVAEIGYKEVEPVGYNNLAPAQYRALLDKYGLSAPSTHAGASGATQADLEKVLEGYQVMGIKHSMGISIGGGGRGGGGRGGGAATIASVKARAAQSNEMGKIGAKFGVKFLIHNHTTEFNVLDDGKTTTYDVLLAETDPQYVTMELDIGWASVAGQDILGLFKKYPGRFTEWHVKDAWGIKSIDPALTPGQRQSRALLVPVGRGEVDYKTIFANAKLAGLEHFFVEQDNASDWGDSVAAARVSYQNLVTRVLAPTG